MSETSLIHEKLTLLRQAFGPPRMAVDSSMLWKIYKKEGVHGLVLYIKRDFKIFRPLEIALVRSGGHDSSVAWTTLPKVMPIYGSTEFDNVRITVWLRRYLLQESNFHGLLVAISHELSHILVGSLINNDHDEKLIDLTSMYLGYAEVVGSNPEIAIVKSTTKASIWPPRLSKQVIVRFRMGYLSAEEKQEALTLIQQWRT